jgi:hypothetical protein
MGNRSYAGSVTTRAAGSARPWSIFLDAEGGKQQPTFGHQRQTEARDPLGRLATDRLAGEADLAALGLDEADQTFEERRLAGAVGADERDRLARVDVDRQVEERLESP